MFLYVEFTSQTKYHVSYTHIILQVFLNIVLDDAVEEKAGGEKVRVGMVVSRPEKFQRMQN